MFYSGYAIVIRRCAICDQKYITDKPEVEKICNAVECYIEYQKDPLAYQDTRRWLAEQPVPYDPKYVRPVGARFEKGEKWSRKIPLEVRQDIAFRDKGKCRYCGDPYQCIDHIIPYSKGGSSNTAANLVQACERCNILVWDREFESFKEKREWIRDKVFHRVVKHYVVTLARS